MGRLVQTDIQISIAFSALTLHTTAWPACRNLHIFNKIQEISDTGPSAQSVFKWFMLEFPPWLPSVSMTFVSFLYTHSYDSHLYEESLQHLISPTRQHSDRCTCSSQQQVFSIRDKESLQGWGKTIQCLQRSLKATTVCKCNCVRMSQEFRLCKANLILMDPNITMYSFWCCCNGLGFIMFVLYEYFKLWERERETCVKLV